MKTVIEREKGGVWELAGSGMPLVLLGLSGAWLAAPPVTAAFVGGLAALGLLGGLYWEAGERRRAAGSILHDAVAGLADLPDAVLVLGPSEEILWSNPSARRLFGLSATDSVRWPADLLLIDERSNTPYAPHALPWQSCRSGVPVQAVECGLRRAGGGEDSWLSLSATRIGMPGQATDGVLLIFQEVTERRRQFSRLANLAQYDSLTGLPNRHFFQEQLRGAMSRASRSQRHLALFFLDLDGFKQINDQLGHATGDEVLRNVAAKLKGSLRAGDTVARLAGDEFTVIVEGVEVINHLDSVAEKILSAVSEPLQVEGRSLQVTPSIGISLYRPGETIDSMLHKSDTAMYLAKHRGGASYAYYPARGRSRRRIRAD